MSSGNSKEKPILLTGAHRSGTTWVSEMLALSKEIQVASEPFNIAEWAYKLDGLAKNWFFYAPQCREKDVINAFRKVLECKTGKIYGRRKIQRYIPFTRKGRLLIKDPISCFSSEWLAKRFDMNVVVLIRHPAAFSASLKRMNWYLDFSNLSDQEFLMDDLLYDYRSEIINPPKDIIDQSILLWKIIYSVLHKYLQTNPEWISIRHEDLSRSPVDEFRKLYSNLNLEWSNNIVDKLEVFTSSKNKGELIEGVAHQMKRDSGKNIFRWKNVLDQNEIVRIKESTLKIANLFYSNDDW